MWLQVGQTVEGVVELVKDSASYLVISLPEHGAALGFAASKDFNGFGIDAGARFEIGQTVTATVAALPEPATGVHCHRDMELTFGSDCVDSKILLRDYDTAAELHEATSTVLTGSCVLKHGIMGLMSCVSSAGGRMLLRVSLTAARPTESGRKRKRHEKVQPGSVVDGTVLKAHPLYVDVQLADGGALPRPGVHLLSQAHKLPS